MFFERKYSFKFSFIESNWKGIEMKCPVCPATDLLMTVREGIEIDYCPKCRGVWLDRGELDHIVRRATQESLAELQDSSRPKHQGHHGEDERERHLSRRHDGYRYEDTRDKHAQSRRKKSFLGDLFDFD
jgi:uncharacterized protein